MEPVKHVKEVRFCANCKQEFNYKDVKNRYPLSRHSILGVYWVDPKIDFYCSCCYLLKLIRLAKEKKNI